MGGERRRGSQGEARDGDGRVMERGGQRRGGVGRVGALLDGGAAEGLVGKVGYGGRGKFQGGELDVGEGGVA